jgi:MFS family permease
MSDGLTLRQGRGAGIRGTVPRIVASPGTVALAVALTVAIGAALLWLGPPGSDTAAHVYQRDLYRSEGFVTWDNHWYSGRHVFVTYSWLYYPLASAIGIRLLAAVSLAVATAAFALLVDWRPAVLAFAAVWGLYALSGAYPFMLGVAFASVGLLALRRGWWWIFAPLAILAWGASPLALLLLTVIVVGTRRWRAAAFCLALVAVQIVLAHLYHGRGHFPFPWSEWIAALVFSTGGLIVSRGKELRGIFAAYLAFVLLAFAFQSQLGENAARLRFMALPLALLAVRFRPLWVAVPLVALCTAYNLTPLAWSYAKSKDEVANNRVYWASAVAYLRAHRDPNFRVNALDTVGHWEAVYLPEAGFPITRGWYRQDDFPENEILYSDDLNRRSYVRWLHERGVRYVLVPGGRLDYSSEREAKVARTLPFVTRRGDVSIYEAPRAQPIAPGVDVLRMTHERVTVRLPRAGRYVLKIRGHETFVAPRAGTYTFDFS